MKYADAYIPLILGLLAWIFVFDRPLTFQTVIFIILGMISYNIIKHALINIRRSN